MAYDVRDLSAFYDSPLGQLAQRAVLQRLRALWPDLRGYRLLGYGFTIPYLRVFRETERAVAAMPAALGVMTWPAKGRTTVLCDEDALPFCDVLFDRILIVHGLEASESLRPLLRQLWRVLAPEGRILIVAANRASLWSQVELSPFGHGRPFSKLELDSILKAALFQPRVWDRALYAPPVQNRTLTGTGAGWERIGRRLFPGISGVHIVEAGKSLYAAPTPAFAKTAKQPALKAAEDF